MKDEEREREREGRGEDGREFNFEVICEQP